MAANVRGPNTRRKHLNKSRKKSWKKINIDDVEGFLEDQRLQERTGGLVAEKKDEQLFYVDTKKKPVKAKKSSLQKKRKAKQILSKLEADLAPPPAKKPNSESAAIKKLAKKITKNKQLKRKPQEAQVDQVETSRETVANFDLWDVDLDAKFQGMDPHYLRSTKKIRAKVPKHHEAPVSRLKAVEVPHPGASYNPDYEQYQALMLKAHSKEVENMKKERKVHRSLTAKFPKAEDAPTEASMLKEMSAGLFEEEGQDDEDGDGVLDLDKISVNPPVRREKKKTEQQRRKIRERKIKEKERLDAKATKERELEVFRLKRIKKDLVLRDKLIEEKAARRQQVRAARLFHTRRLGKLRYEDPDEDLKMGGELVGSLRELKTEGSLLADRFKSLQKRNIIEPRLRARFRRRYKPKLYEKKGSTSIIEMPMTTEETKQQALGS